jgi:hypothetical protein
MPDMYKNASGVATMPDMSGMQGMPSSVQSH